MLPLPVKGRMATGSGTPSGNL